jgi:hypothetical protein
VAQQNPAPYHNDQPLGSTHIHTNATQASKEILSGVPGFPDLLVDVSTRRPEGYHVNVNAEDSLPPYH